VIVITMGVAGSGKTAIGSLPARELGWDFYDANDFHSESNRAKMSNRIALADEDCTVWLLSLQKLISKNIQLDKSIVLTCSELKTSYRNILSVSEQVRFVYLQGTYEQIKTRLRNRTGQFHVSGYARQSI